MRNELKRIDATISRLHDLQASQLESFEKGSLPDLEKQSAERDIEVGKLTRRVIKFKALLKHHNEAATQAILEDFNGRIAALLDQNIALEKQVRTLRNRIKDQMEQVSKGKKVITQYRSLPGASINPRVISITN